LSRQIAYDPIVGFQNGASEKRAFNRYLDVVPIHHQPFVPACDSSTARRKALQGILLAENTSMEQLPFQMSQLIAITNPFEGGTPRVPTILQQEKIASALVKLPRRVGLMGSRSAGHERVNAQQ
jgi:hypothetical protein